MVARIGAGEARRDARVLGILLAGMTLVPALEPNTRGFGNVVRYAATQAGVYVLDEAHRLWVLRR